MIILLSDHFELILQDKAYRFLWNLRSVIKKTCTLTNEETTQRVFAFQSFNSVGSVTWLQLPEEQEHVTERENMCTSPRLPSCEMRESIRRGGGGW